MVIKLKSREDKAKRINRPYRHIVIPLKLFLDLLRDPLFPRGLSDIQSYVLNFTNVEVPRNAWQRLRIKQLAEDVQVRLRKLQP